MKKLLIILFTLLFTFNAYAIQLGHGKGEAVPSAADVSGNTAEGRISWDSDNNKLYMGDGAAVSQIASVTLSEFYAYPAADQDNLTDSTWTTVTLGSELYDTGSNFASNTFTAPITGIYFLAGQIAYEGTDLVVDKGYEARLNKNAGTIIALATLSACNADYAHCVNVRTIVQLAANDTVILQAQQKSGGNLTDIDTDGSYVSTYFFGYRLD